jgi:hypothetical protein
MIYTHVLNPPGIAGKESPGQIKRVEVRRKQYDYLDIPPEMADYPIDVPKMSHS